MSRRVTAADITAEDAPTFERGRERRAAVGCYLKRDARAISGAARREARAKSGRKGRQA